MLLFQSHPILLFHVSMSSSSSFWLNLALPCIPGELHTALALRILQAWIHNHSQADRNFMCYVNSLPYKAMRRLGKHTTYEFQTHVELDAPSVMCSWFNITLYLG